MAEPIKRNYREKISDELLSYIEKEGANPWVKEWESFIKNPKNPISGTEYRGGNAVYLAFQMMLKKQYDLRFATKTQIESKGGRVLDYKDGYMIEFFQKGRNLNKKEIDSLFNQSELKKVLETLSIGQTCTVMKTRFIKGGQQKEDQIVITKLINNKTKKPYLSFKLNNGVPIRRFARVFDLSNTEGILEKYPAETPKEYLWASLEDESLDLVIDNLLADINVSLSVSKLINQPCFAPLLNTINMPDKSLFKTKEAYYGTLFHEYGHALIKKGAFVDGYLINNGSEYSTNKEERAKEEVLVEMFSVLLAAETGVKPCFENSSNYIKSWAKAISEDESLFHKVSRIANNMADYAIKTLREELSSEIDAQESSGTVFSTMGP